MLLLLVTDHGFLNELDHIWETLDDIDGGGNFLDSQFRWSSTSQTQQRREESSKAARTEHVDDTSAQTEENSPLPDIEYGASFV